MHQKKHSLYGLFIFLLAGSAFSILPGCMKSPHYQKTYALPGQQWAYKDQPAFQFQITDTTALYHLYFLIRHTEAYPYSNIWLWLYTRQPGDTTYEKSRIEIPLAEKSGKWLGRGMGEIWEHRMPITRDDQPMIFSRQGIYEIRMEQNMRTDSLPEILDVGLRLSLAGHRSKK